MASIRELKLIQRKLDKWELEHLREHAAALSIQLESATAEIARLENELYSAEARADMFCGLANDLQDKTGARVGITLEGQMGVLAC